MLNKNRKIPINNSFFILLSSANSAECKRKLYSKVLNKVRVLYIVSESMLKALNIEALAPRNSNFDRESSLKSLNIAKVKLK